MSKIDNNLIVIYTKVLKYEWKIVDFNSQSDNEYIVALFKESNWPYDPEGSGSWEEYVLVPR